MLRNFILIAIWRRAKEPAIMQIKLELFYGMWVFIAEAAWLIYGNTFIYTSQIKDCDANFNQTIGGSVDADTLRATCLALIIYGYLLLAGLFFIICFGTVLYFGFQNYKQEDVVQR